MLCRVSHSCTGSRFWFADSLAKRGSSSFMSRIIVTVVSSDTSHINDNHDPDNVESHASI